MGYSCVKTLYFVSFDCKDAINLWTFQDYFNEFVEYTFILDLLLNFIQSYINPETLQEHRGLKEIARNYMFNGWFFVDFVSVFPFEAFFENG